MPDDPASPTAPTADRFRVGETVTTSVRTISTADIEEFAHLTGDENPLHLDDAFAAGQLFHGRVAHGLLTLSATLGLWYQCGLFDGWIVVFLGIDKLRFVKPVRPGESLSARLHVVSREPSPRGDRVELENTTVNAKEEPVLTFSAHLLISRPAGVSRAISA